MTAVWRIGITAGTTIVGGSILVSRFPRDIGDLSACVLVTLIVFVNYSATFAATPDGPGRLRSMLQVVRHFRTRGGEVGS